MKRELMASVLLAGMIFSMPVYADDDRTPDEYNPEAKYESPLNRSHGPVVNDARKVRAEDENELFSKAAGQLIQGSASGKRADSHQSALRKAEKQAE